MKSGNVQKQPNEFATEYKVVLEENGIEVGIIYLDNETRADRILKEWIEGTYRLLHG